MTPLEALEKIRKKQYFVDFELDTTVGKDCKQELDIIESALKALDFLKEHITLIETHSGKQLLDINYWDDEEGFNLVKEILYEKD